MGYRNISTSDEVYRLLSSMKRKGESFNAFFKRSFGARQKPDLMELAGSWKMTDGEWMDVNRELGGMWGKWDERLRH